MEAQALLALTLLSLYASGSYSTKLTFTNNCAFTVWPGTLGKTQLSLTGFELSPKNSFSLDAPNGWSGRFWARTQCSKDPLGKFTCKSADCGSGQIQCNGAGAIPPASLVELTINASTKDYYDTSLVDGFNLPLSMTPQGGVGGCHSTSCPKNVSSVCPLDLALKSDDGSVIACKSACVAFNTPEYCCKGDFGTPKTCHPTNYSKWFKDQCPQSYSYAYDDKASLFSCSGSPDYTITFCP